MKFSKLLIIPFFLQLFFGFHFVILAQTTKPDSPTSGFTDNDRAEIIKSVLLRELSLSDDDRTRYIKPYPKRLDPCRNSKKIRQEFISSQNINEGLLPEISCIKFVLLSTDDINERKVNGVRYIVFDKIEFKNEKVEVRIAAVHRATGYISSTGTIFEYSKESGKWAGKMIGGYGEQT